MDIPALAKNPYVLGGGALLVLVITLMSRSGSSGGSDAGLQSQALATSANVSLATLTTQENIAQIGANLANAQDKRGNDTAQYLATLGAFANFNNNMTTIATTNIVANAGVQTNRDTVNGTIQLARDMEAFQTAILPQMNEYQLASQRLSNEGNVQLASIQANTALQIARSQESVAKAPYSLSNQLFNSLNNSMKYYAESGGWTGMG